MTKKKQKNLTQDQVRKLFSYDPETGKVTRVVTRMQKAKAGDSPGTVDKTGYIRVTISGRSYALHRVIWLYVHGYLPEHDIDHINRIRTDNRLENLREATRSCNIKNSKVYDDSVSGVKGVTWFSRDSEWRARIRSRLLSVDAHLGKSTDFIEVVAHRLAAEQCLDWSGCNSSSSAYDTMQNYLQSLQPQAGDIS